MTEKIISSFVYQLICIIAAVLVAAIIFLTIPRYASQPQGILLPTKISRKPTLPEKVMNYPSQPATAQVLGTIRIERHYIDNKTLAEKQIWMLANSLAAKAGANGIVLNSFGYTKPGSMPDDQMKFQFSGTAIYVRGRHD